MNGEEGIVWLVDPLDYPYLREGVVTCVWRIKKPRKPAVWRMVAYSECGRKGEHNRGGYYSRRVWYLLPGDDTSRPFPGSVETASITATDVCAHLEVEL